MNTLPVRRPWQGMFQIVRFNWQFYFATVASVGIGLIALPLLPPAAGAIMFFFLAPSLFWTVSSLLVSHFVYDVFPLYDMRWIARALSHAPRRWANIHNGFDETSPGLSLVFPNAVGETVDIFDPHVMTEKSIQRARQLKLCATPSLQARYDALPFRSDSMDAVFSIFVAHELRRHHQRIALFREIGRILTSDGEFVLVEHLRDWRNFLAFGPGFLHFFSQPAWRNAASDAHLALRTDFSLTPFVHVYVFRRVL